MPAQKQRPSPCQTCQSKSRADIEAALTNGLSHRAIASQFGVGRMSVQRHSVNCMTLPAVTDKLKKTIAKQRKTVEDTVAAVIASVEAPEVRTPEALQTWNERLLHALDRQRIAAEGRGDFRLGVALAREEVGLLANVARNLGITREGTTINLVDASTRKLEIAVGKLSTEQLDAALASIAGGGAIQLPAGLIETNDGD